MTFDDILLVLRTAPLPPTHELNEAVAHADTLAPLVYERLAQLCRGICLLPEDESLLFYGLHVLAAARRADLWPRLVELARVPEDELDGFFASHAPQSLAQLMLSVWDGDTDALLRLIEHADMGHDAKWALFDVLARATFDGRIPRETTLAFLERFEREALAEDDSEVWWGWETAIRRLGLVELEPAIRRAWSKPVYEVIPENERLTEIEALHAAAAAPADPAPFDKDHITPVTDIGATLEWVRHREILHQQWKAEAGPLPPHLANDPAHDIRLTQDEQMWLAVFLVSRQVDPTALTLPMLDGYLTGLVIGPAEPPPAVYMPLIWGEGDGETNGVPNPASEPTWADEAQRNHVLGLIARHRDAIACRRDAGAMHVPLIPSSAATNLAAIAAQAWAQGFALALDLNPNVWDRLFEDIRGAEDGLAVLALCPGETGYFEREATTAEREQIAERLPRILQRISTYWRAPANGYPGGTPVRVQKIGRNDPCPCGSGQKYKKCCALKPPPVLN